MVTDGQKMQMATFIVFLDQATVKPTGMDQRQEKSQSDPKIFQTTSKKFLDTKRKGKIMLVGNSSACAIESYISQVYSNLGAFALGYFVIHVAGKVYGVRDPDASLLACSFDEVRRRLKRRGHHSFPDISGFSAERIAEAVHNAIYSEEPDDYVLNMPAEEFIQTLYARKIIWAPDGDAAFDDGGHVLQIDEEDRVRLIAFINDYDAEIIRKSVSEVFLPPSIFYNTLQTWKDMFERERNEKLIASHGHENRLS